jgi:hypothetical protein
VIVAEKNLLYCGLHGNAHGRYTMKGGVFLLVGVNPCRKRVSGQFGFDHSPKKAFLYAEAGKTDVLVGQTFVAAFLCRRDPDSDMAGRNDDFRVRFREPVGNGTGKDKSQFTCSAAGAEMKGTGVGETEISEYEIKARTDRDNPFLFSEETGRGDIL